MKLRLVLFALCLIGTMSTLAHAQYSAVYVFGDSFCDTGNIFIATNTALPTAPYYEGRFSNGPLWVEQFADSLHLAVGPWLGGGTNYAFGGAQLLQTTLIPSIPNELEAYLFFNFGRADPNALYIIEGGTNDVLVSSITSSTKLGKQIGEALGSIESQLYASGATHFLMVNLPDLGLLPVAASDPEFASATSISANNALQKFVVSAQSAQSADINTLDMYAFSENVFNDPTHNGFTNITTPCLSDANEVCADPAHTYFWDWVHPTTAANALLANFAEQQFQQ